MHVYMYFIFFYIFIDIFFPLFCTEIQLFGFFILVVIQNVF